MCIFCEPLIGCGAVVYIHPGKLEQHIVEDWVGFCTLWSRTDTLAIVVVCKCLEVAVHCSFQTAVQAAAATEVVEHTVNVRAALIVASISGVAPFCSIACIDVIREEVEADETVAIAAHCTECTALRNVLPVLDNPFCLIVLCTNFV